MLKVYLLLQSRVTETEGGWEKEWKREGGYFSCLLVHATEAPCSGASGPGGSRPLGSSQVWPVGGGNSGTWARTCCVYDLIKSKSENKIKGGKKETARRACVFLMGRLRCSTLSFSLGRTNSWRTLIYFPGDRKELRFQLSLFISAALPPTSSLSTLSYSVSMDDQKPLFIFSDITETMLRHPTSTAFPNRDLPDVAPRGVCPYCQPHTCHWNTLAFSSLPPPKGACPHCQPWTLTLISPKRVYDSLAQLSLADFNFWVISLDIFSMFTFYLLASNSINFYVFIVRSV